jgi:hypothetical protein
VGKSAQPQPAQQHEQLGRGYLPQTALPLAPAQAPMKLVVMMLGKVETAVSPLQVEYAR